MSSHPSIEWGWNKTILNSRQQTEFPQFFHNLCALRELPSKTFASEEIHAKTFFTGGRRERRENAGTRNTDLILDFCDPAILSLSFQISAPPRTPVQNIGFGVIRAKTFLQEGAEGAEKNELARHSFFARPKSELFGARRVRRKTGIAAARVVCVQRSRGSGIRTRSSSRDRPSFALETDTEVAEPGSRKALTLGVERSAVRIPFDGE
jgi:hypothetical protein